MSEETKKPAEAPEQEAKETDPLHPDVKDGNMGVFVKLCAYFCQKKR